MMVPAARRQARDLASGRRNDLVGGGGVGVCLTMDFDGFGAEEEEKSLVVAARCSDRCTLDRIIYRGNRDLMGCSFWNETI